MSTPTKAQLSSLDRTVLVRYYIRILATEARECSKAHPDDTELRHLATELDYNQHNFADDIDNPVALALACHEAHPEDERLEFLWANIDTLDRDWEMDHFLDSLVESGLPTSDDQLALTWEQLNSKFWAPVTDWLEFEVLDG